MNIFLKNLLSIFVITIIILSGIIQSESADYLIEDNSISVNEDRSEYFRNEILNNLSKMQILSYLNRKETVEKPSSKELAAKYILNLLPPYDRKLDTAIGNNWDSLSSNEKDALRFEWFQKNKNSVSTRELQTYIAISDLIQKAREAENQRKIRENRHKIDFAQTMSDSQFIMVLEKTIKTIAPKVEPVSAKPVLKEQPSEKSYSKKSKSSKPAKKKSLKSKKKQKVSKKQKKSGKPEVIQNIEPVKPRDLKNILDDSIESRVKTRELNANEIKNSSAVKKSSDENQFDEKIKTLQSKISNLKTQLNTTSSEIDSLKNLKKDNRSGKDETKSVSDDKKTREELRKLELEKIKSIGVE